MVNRIVVRPVSGPAEYPALVAVWESAVLATHDFLAESDFLRIKDNLAPYYFPAVTMIVAERAGDVLGFAGVAAGNLEMLFVAASAQGTGVGTALLQAAITEHGARSVDVNEQNDSARSFYERRGFVQVGRSELDGDGRPCPILRLKLR